MNTQAGQGSYTDMLVMQVGSNSELVSDNSSSMHGYWFYLGGGEYSGWPG